MPFTTDPRPCIGDLLSEAQRLLERAPSLASGRVLVVGDNVNPLVGLLGEAGADVVCAVGSADAMRRLRQRHESVPAGMLTDRRFNPGRCDAAVLWETRQPLGVRRLVQGATVVWRRLRDGNWTAATGWRRRIPAWRSRRGAYRQAPRIADDVPLGVHVHLPKNAGTSLNDLLYDSFGYGHLALYDDDPQFSHTSASMDRAIRRNPAAMVISSHSFRQFPARIAGRQALYFTTLRHPLDRSLSYFRYARQHYAQLPEAQRRTLPPEFPEMTPTEFLRFQDNLFQQGIQFDQTKMIHPSGDPRRAIEILERFFLVGLVEEMDGAVDLLRRRLRPLGLCLAGSLPRANATHAPPADMQDPPLEAAHLQPDLVLYDWARRRFAQQFDRA